MSIDRPAPGEELNRGPETAPRQAATVILLRGGEQALEVLLVKRNPQARFMGGAWVFPGGALDAADGENGHRVAAVRELREEARVTLDDPSTLVEYSRWITPAQVKIRYDTHFFLAELPAGQHPVVDGEECVDLDWFTPARALTAHAGGEILLVFPTIKHLEQLGVFSSVTELLQHARGREVVPVQPRVLLSGGEPSARPGGEVARLVLPGEPGYDDADAPG